MFKTIRNAWKLPELRRKLLFVIFALLIFRVGAAIPVPYINTEYLQDYIAANSGTIFGLLNTLSGSALSQATLFALSIQPYINASIIIQLLTIAIPALERLAKDGGEEGKKKIQSITRYATLAIGLLQGWGYYTLIRSYGLLTNEGVWAAVVIVVSFTAGAVFLMWLGEQITEFGVGNGISIILFTGIVSRIPHMIMSLVTGVKNWAANLDMTNWTEQQINSTIVMNPGIVALLVVPERVMVNMFFLAASRPLRMASGTSAALPRPKPTLPFSSPTTTRAENFITRPPLTVLETRFRETTFSTNSLGSLSNLGIFVSSSL